MMPPYESVLAFFFAHELLTHALLIGGDVVATIAIGWGILWESPSQPVWRHSVATWLVIVGVIAETLCSVSLFAYDESISQAQQEKIIRLETHLDEALKEICVQGIDSEIGMSKFCAHAFDELDNTKTKNNE